MKKKRRYGMADKVLEMHMRNRYWTVDKIARELKANRAYVFNVFKRANMPIPKSHKRVFQDWERQALLDGYIAGEKCESLAKEFSTTSSAISRIAKRSGIDLRHPVCHSADNVITN